MKHFSEKFARKETRISIMHHNEHILSYIKMELVFKFSKLQSINWKKVCESYTRHLFYFCPGKNCATDFAHPQNHRSPVVMNFQPNRVAISNEGEYFTFRRFNFVQLCSR